MRKRIMSLLLCLIMALSLLPATAVTAFAAGTAQSGKAVLGGFAVGQEAGSVYIGNNTANSLKILAHKTNASYGEYTPDKRVGKAAILGAYNPKSAMAIRNPDYAYNENGETSIVVDGTGRRMARTDTFQSGVIYRFSFCEIGQTLYGAPFADYLGELTTDNFTFRTAPGATSPTITRVEAIPQRAGDGSETKGFFYNVYIKMPGDKVSHTVNVTTPVSTNKTTATEGTAITLTAPKFHDSKTFTGWQIAVGSKTYTHKADFRDYCGLTDFSSSEGGTENVTCTFKMGDRDISVKALYSADAIIEFNTVNLNILPVVKDGEPVAMVRPVFGSEGEAYSVGYAFLGKDDKNKTEPGFYTGMKSGEKFDTSQYRYLLTVWLYVNIDHYKFTGNKDAVKFVINGTEYPGASGKIIDREDDRCPVSYEHLSGFNSVGEKYETLRVYIPVGVPNNLQPYYNDGITATPALKFVDAPSIDSVTVTRTGSGSTECGSATTSGFTMELEQGINYTVNVKVRVPKAIQDAINSGLMQLQPQFRYLMNSADMGTNLWQGTQVTPAVDSATGDTIYTYSTINFGPVAGENYMLVFGTNLVTTGSDAQRIAGNVITGTFNCVNTKITDGPTLTGNALKAGATSGPELTTSSTQYYIDMANTTAWDIPTAGGAVSGKTYWTMLCLRPNSGYVFDPDYDYTPAVTLGGAAVRTNCAVTVDGSAMFLTVYATATHEHVMQYVANADGTHTYKCTVTGCYSYNGRKEAHTWGEEGTVSGSDITYTCEKCSATRTETYTAPGAGVTTIYGFFAKVTTPKAGDTVGNATDWLTMRNNRDGKVQVAEAKWVKQGETTPFTGTFEAGKKYTITVTFEAAENYKINESTSAVLLNSNGTALARTDDAPNRTVTQSMSFTVKKPVDVTITLPDLKAGDTLALPTYSVADDAVASIYCVATVNETSYTYDFSSGAWASTPPTLTSGDVVVYGYRLDEKAGYEFATTTIVTNTAANLTNHFDGIGGFFASYTIPNAKAISKVALTVSGYEYGKSVSAAVKGSDPANVTIGALSWNPSDTTFGAGAYTVTIPVTPAAGYSFADGCLFTVNGYPAVYASGAVTCTLPALTAPHTHTFGSWTYLNDAVHYRSCTGCGATEIKEHTWTQTAKTDATTEAPGSVTYKCSDCGAEKTEVIPQLTADPGTSGGGTSGGGTSGGGTSGGGTSGGGTSGGGTSGGSTSGGSTSGGSTGGAAITGRKSATTADPGILLYGVMALSSYTGTALLVRGRKKHD